jgi:hypothetical protein
MYSRINPFVAADGGHEVPARPKVLPDEVPPTLSVDPRQMDRALPLDEPDHLRHRVIGRDRDQHMHVIRQQVPFLDPTLFLLRQLPEHLPQVLPQPAIQRPPAAFRYEHHVVLAVPHRVVQDSPVCPSGPFLSCAWRLTREVSSVGTLRQTSNDDCLPGKAGGSPHGLGMPRPPGGAAVLVGNASLSRHWPASRQTRGYPAVAMPLIVPDRIATSVRARLVMRLRGSAQACETRAFRNCPLILHSPTAQPMLAGRP